MGELVSMVGSKSTHKAIDFDEHGHMRKSNQYMTLQPLGKVENPHKHSNNGKKWVSTNLEVFSVLAPIGCYLGCINIPGKNLAPVHPLLTYAIPFHSLFLVEHVTHHTQSINQTRIKPFTESLE